MVEHSNSHSTHCKASVARNKITATTYFSKIPNTSYRACMSLENTHKPIRIYMGGLISGANTLYKLFCFFKLFAAIGKGLTDS